MSTRFDPAAAHNAIVVVTQMYGGLLNELTDRLQKAEQANVALSKVAADGMKWRTALASIADGRVGEGLQKAYAMMMLASGHDREDQGGLPGACGVGPQPVEAGPEQGRGEGAAGPSREVQAHRQVGEAQAARRVSASITSPPTEWESFTGAEADRIAGLAVESHPVRKIP